MTSPTPHLDQPWTGQPAGLARIEQPVSLLRLDGPDTLRFLHGQTSQALLLARPGQWLRTCCLTPTGRLRALAEVLVAEGGAWLVITAGDGPGVRAALDRVLFPADNVRLGELEEALLIQPLGASPGGKGEEQLLPRSPTDTWVSLEGGEGWLLGEQLLVREGCEPPAWLTAFPPLAPQEVEVMRIRRGLPAVPGEINDDTNPFELGLASRVSLAKGCYAGQETLARLATYDGVKQQLRRWHCPDSAVEIPSGATLRTDTGERAGTITSAARLTQGPGVGARGWIGLALIRRQALAMGQLLVELPAGEGKPPVSLSISLPDDFMPPPVGAGGASAG
jgi:folate-binding protein YgfZ